MVKSADRPRIRSALWSLFHGLCIHFYFLNICKEARRCRLVQNERGCYVRSLNSPPLSLSLLNFSHQPRSIYVKKIDCRFNCTYTGIVICWGVKSLSLSLFLLLPVVFSSVQPCLHLWSRPQNLRCRSHHPCGMTPPRTPPERSHSGGGRGARGHSSLSGTHCC